MERRVLWYRHKIRNTFCQRFNWMLQLSSGWKSKYSVETSNLKLASENFPFHLCRSQLRSHLFWNYAFWRYTYIPKLCHRYSQVAGEDSIELVGKRMENLESVCAVEGCALIFPRWGLPSPSMRCQIVKVTLQAWTACSNWPMWLQDSPRRCCSSWLQLAAMLIRFRVSKSVTRSNRCSSSTTIFVRSISRSGWWMLLRCMWHGLQIWSCLSRLLVTWPSQYRWTPQQTYNRVCIGCFFHSLQ